MGTYELFDAEECFVKMGTKEEMRQLGLLTRSVHIFIFDEIGQLLICKRPATKKVYPNVFTSSAGWHVESGESFEEAAYREMQEEVGLNSPLIECGRFDVINDRERSIHHLYLCYPTRTQLDALVFETAEVAETAYVLPVKIFSDIQTEATKYAPSFLEAMRLYSQKRQFIVDFDHTLFDWYSCKHALKVALEETFKVSDDVFESTKEQCEQELNGLYSIDRHLELIGIQKTINQSELRAFLDAFLEDNYLYPDAQKFLKNISQQDIVTILTYGDEANQLKFIQANIAPNSYKQVICVDSKDAKTAWAKRLSYANLWGTVFLNDDPKEWIAMTSVIQNNSQYFMLERPNAKYTKISEQAGYAVIRSLDEIGV